MPLPPLTPDLALFTDFDGTLVAIEERPDSVRVASGLPGLLRRVESRLGGALAVISGRSLATIDELLEGSVVAVAGVHGLERRTAAGLVIGEPLPEAALDAARTELHGFVGAHEGVLLEDKGAALALHYRRAPQHEAACREAVAAVARQHPAAFVVQAGKMVEELRARGGTKGDAVARFLDEAPFRGRTPVFVGDDLTDEESFHLVNARGGLSLRVGAIDGSAARHAIADVPSVHRWLAAFGGAS